MIVAWWPASLPINIDDLRDHTARLIDDQIKLPVTSEFLRYALSVVNKTRQFRMQCMRFNWRRRKVCRLPEGVGFGWIAMYVVKNEMKAGTLRELKYVAGSRYRFTPHFVRRTNGCSDGRVYGSSN
jgi:hypothetical protein